MSEQLALFDGGIADVELADLEGLLVAGAALVRHGPEVRLSLIVGQPWRAAALIEEFELRGLAGEVASTFDGQFAVRTPFARDLAPLAQGWTSGSVKRAPANWKLTPARTRLWALAAGTTDQRGYLLGLGRSDDPAGWSRVGAALAGAGLTGTLLGLRSGGPAYRIVGQRRLRRLRALIGIPPTGVPVSAWPPREE